MSCVGARGRGRWHTRGRSRGRGSGFHGHSRGRGRPRGRAYYDYKWRGRQKNSYVQSHANSTPQAFPWGVPLTPESTPESDQVSDQEEEAHGSMGADANTDIDETKLQDLQRNLVQLALAYQSKVSETQDLHSLSTVLSEFLIVVGKHRLDVLHEFHRLHLVHKKKMSNIEYSVKLQSDVIDADNLKIDQEIRELQEKKKRNQEKKRNIQGKLLSAVYLNAKAELSEVQQQERSRVEEIQTKKAAVHKTAHEKLQVYEKEYALWRTDETIYWLRIIGKGAFEDFTDKIFDKMEEHQMTLNDLNECTLKLLGFDEHVIRDILLPNLHRLLLDERHDHGNESELSDERNDICIVCFLNRINTVTLPCGHQALCDECYSSSPRQFARCSVCYAKVDRIIKIFMSGIASSTGTCK